MKPEDEDDREAPVLIPTTEPLSLKSGDPGTITVSGIEVSYTEPPDLPGAIVEIRPSPTRKTVSPERVMTRDPRSGTLPESDTGNHFGSGDVDVAGERNAR